MAEFQQQGQNWSGQNPVIGTGEGEVPLAKPPIADITVRTMTSDISSMKATGGGEPRPYEPKEVTYSATPAQTQTPPAVPQPVQSNVAPIQAAPIQPAPTQTVPIVAAPAVGKPSSSSNILFITLVSVIVLLGLGAVGYFFVYPLFSTPSIPAVTEQPVVPQTEPAAEPVAPETAMPAIEEVAPATTTQFLTIEAHKSLLKTAADFSSEAVISEVTPEMIKEVLESNPVEVPVLREITFKNNLGEIYATETIMPLLMPSVFTSSTVQLFSIDASFITYTDASGAWPIFVLQLAANANADAAKTAIAEIEKNQEYQTLFLANPGTASVWKDGKVGDAAARYVSFTEKNVAFSYTWLGDKLVLSSSYAGAQKVAKQISQ